MLRGGWRGECAWRMTTCRKSASGNYPLTSTAAIIFSPRYRGHNDWRIRQPIVRLYISKNVRGKSIAQPTGLCSELSYTSDVQPEIGRGGQEIKGRHSRLHCSRLPACAGSFRANHAAPSTNSLPPLKTGCVCKLKSPALRAREVVFGLSATPPISGQIDEVTNNPNTRNLSHRNYGLSNIYFLILSKACMDSMVN